MFLGFESKILNKVLESEEPEEMCDDSEEQAKKEALMLGWEKENLVDDYQKAKINTTWPVMLVHYILTLFLTLQHSYVHLPKYLN